MTSRKVDRMQMQRGQVKFRTNNNVSQEKETLDKTRQLGGKQSVKPTIVTRKMRI